MVKIFPNFKLFKKKKKEKIALLTTGLVSSHNDVLFFFWPNKKRKSFSYELLLLFFLLLLLFHTKLILIRELKQNLQWAYNQQDVSLYTELTEPDNNYHPN